MSSPCLFSRYPSAQSQGAPNGIVAAPGNGMAQADVLVRENERLRKELEAHAEKAARLQKVREQGGWDQTQLLAPRGCGNRKKQTILSLPVHVGGDELSGRWRTLTGESPVVGSQPGEGFYFSNHIYCNGL